MSARRRERPQSEAGPETGPAEGDGGVHATMVSDRIPEPAAAGPPAYDARATSSQWPRHEAIRLALEAGPGDRPDPELQPGRLQHRAGAGQRERSRVQRRGLPLETYHRAVALGSPEGHPLVRQGAAAFLDLGEQLLARPSGGGRARAGGGRGEELVDVADVARDRRHDRSAELVLPRGPVGGAVDAGLRRRPSRGGCRSGASMVERRRSARSSASEIRALRASVASFGEPTGAAALPRRSRRPGPRRRGRHRPGRDDRHAGAAAGQALRGRPLPRRGRGPRGRGLQLPARRRRRHGHGRGLRAHVVGAGLRRLPALPRPRLPAPRPLARGDRARAVRRRSTTTARRSRRHPARSCVARSSGSPSAASPPTSAPSSSSSSTATPTRRRGRARTATSRPPTSTTSTTRSSAPRGSSRCCAASATR